MVIFQHPDNVWNDFAKKLVVPGKSQIALFATYKISAGSMFKKMRKQLNGMESDNVPKFKSRDGNLSENDKVVLNKFIQR